jgi:xanthine dehydrogenase accessory factor
MVVVLVRGIGDVGSAVAHRLFSAGHAVAIHDGPAPATTRRTMAFTDAVFDGQATLAGVAAIRADGLEQAAALLTARDTIPVVVANFTPALAALTPTILVDARMRKRAVPETQRGLAPLTIGLGPNFVAGETVDLAIETAWGDDLGAVIARGPTRALAGEPRPLAGHARDRFVYAPTAGTFRSGYRIGDPVSDGQLIARIGDTPLAAPLAGTIRGLTRDGVPVAAGTKVIEIDPRGGPPPAGLGERPARIAEGVLRAVDAWLAEARGVGDEVRYARR